MATTRDLKPSAKNPSRNSKDTVWISYDSAGKKKTEAAAPHASIFDRQTWRYLVYGLGILGLAAVLLVLTTGLRGEIGLKTPFTSLLAIVVVLQTTLSAVLGFITLKASSLLDQRLSKVHERSVRLRLSKEELEEVNRTKTDFFNNVSHEFRTPITLTLGPIQGILAGRYGAVPESTRQQLRMMAAQQQRLLQLINQILDAAKLDAGLVVLRASPIADFNTFISSRAEQFRTLSEERGLELKVALDPRVKGQEICIDPEKFDKILFNLLSNAHKFTQHGSIEVATALREPSVVVRVSDTGMGIRKDQIQGVFDRFKQAEGSVSKDFSGTGLGLSLVREYARLHGGEATVTSDYGKGTTFEIKIPLGHAHLDPASVVSSVEANPDELGMTKQAKTAAMASAANPLDTVSVDQLNEASEQALTAGKPVVLYVDDHPELRKYVHGLLKNAYNVFLGVDGRDGLEKARRHRPDLIRSDLMMPEVDGLKFCAQVRADTDLRSIPFGLLTGRAEMDSKVSGLETGADDYLSKPFSEPELLARVKNLVNLRQQQLRLQRELQAARGIQQSLLPPSLSHPLVSGDYLYLPSEELSGDFCDLMAEGDWIFAYVADVTSHGTASAQVTYLLKEIFRATIRLRPDVPLSDLVVSAGKQYADYGLDYDVGIQVARLHAPTKSLEYLRGSAPSGYRIPASGEPEVLAVRPGPALSSRMKTDDPGSYEIFKISLNPGDRVYFFTDGCYEFSANRRDFGLKHFYQILVSAAADTWADDVLKELKKANQGKPFPDDVTVVRLKMM